MFEFITLILGYRILLGLTQSSPLRLSLEEFVVDLVPQEHLLNGPES